MIIEAFLIGTMLANTTGILFLRHVNKERATERKELVLLIEARQQELKKSDELSKDYERKPKNLGLINEHTASV